MIIPDVNLLLYAYDSASPFHAPAARWWRECLSGPEAIGLSDIAVFGFLRIATSARAFGQPRGLTEAAGLIRSWFERPVVQVLEPGPRHIEHVLQLREAVGAGGQLVTDSQLAALAIECGGVLHTSDADFIRFPGLRWYNPITQSGSRAVRRPRQR